MYSIEVFLSSRKGSRAYDQFRPGIRDITLSIQAGHIVFELLPVVNSLEPAAVILMQFPVPLLALCCAISEHIAAFTRFGG